MLHSVPKASEEFIHTVVLVRLPADMQTCRDASRSPLHLLSLLLSVQMLLVIIAFNSWLRYVKPEPCMHVHAFNLSCLFLLMHAGSCCKTHLWQGLASAPLHAWRWIFFAAWLVMILMSTSMYGCGQSVMLTATLCATSGLFVMLAYYRFATSDGMALPADGDTNQLQGTKHAQGTAARKDEQS